MWPPLSVKRGLPVAALSAWATSAPASASSVTALGPGQVLGVESGADAAVDGNDDDPALAVHPAAELLDRPIGGRLRPRRRQPLHSCLADHRAQEGFALAGAAGGAVGVVGVEARAHDRAVADAAGVLAISAARGNGGCDLALGVARHRAHGVSRFLGR